MINSKLYLTLLLVIGVYASTEACTCGRLRGFDEYEYIALVEIVGVMKSDMLVKEKAKKHEVSDQLLAPSPPTPTPPLYEIKVREIDRYKGKDQDFILVHGGNRKYNLGETSCDLSIEIGEKWLVLGYTSNGRITTGYCTHSKVYENEKGEIDYQSNRGTALVDALNEKYNRKKIIRQEGYVGTEYKNGEVKLIKCYEDQKLEDYRVAYYSNGQKMMEEFYVDGLKEGGVMWYNRNGTIKREAEYKSGNQVCEEYHFTNEGKLKGIKFFNDNGEHIGYEKVYGK